MIVLEYYSFARLDFDNNNETGQAKIIYARRYLKTHLHDLGKPHSLGYLCLDLTVYTMLNGGCGR